MYATSSFATIYCHRLIVVFVFGFLGHLSIVVIVVLDIWYCLLPSAIIDNRQSIVIVVDIKYCCLLQLLVNVHFCYRQLLSIIIAYGLSLSSLYKRVAFDLIESDQIRLNMIPIWLLSDVAALLSFACCHLQLLVGRRCCSCQLDSCCFSCRLVGWLLSLSPLHLRRMDSQQVTIVFDRIVYRIRYYRTRSRYNFGCRNRRGINEYSGLI